MPSTTERQARFMAACDHGAGYASCPPKNVSHEFNQADKGTAMLRNAMRKKKALGGPMTNLGAGGANPAQMLQALQARSGPTMAGISPMMRPQVMPGPGASPMGPPGGGGGAGIPQRPMVMPSQPMPMQGGALGRIGPMQPPAPTVPQPMMNRPMPMSGGRPLMARGGMIPPPSSPGPMNFTPRPSPLASLISHRMSAMHAGFPGPRKPRIPLPGQFRNINQTINHSKAKLGGMGLG